LHQPGRRFVYCFSLTPELFQLFLFDRNGVVKSQSIDIHKSAVQFVQAIQMLAGETLSTMGFDPSIYWEDGAQFVDVVNRVDGAAVTIKYRIDRVISRKVLIGGCGTLCWGLTEPVGGRRFVMKDIWLKDEDVREEEFLYAAQQAGITGVTKLHLVDQTHAIHPPSILSHRRDQGLSGDVSANRTFSRLILEDAGPSICHFESGLQFLQALRAAIESKCWLLAVVLQSLTSVLAHLRLVKAGILHRDICPSHILLGQQEGSPAGVLADFKSATRCDRGKTPAEKDAFVVSLTLATHALRIR